jgi:inward rectifier potassium channel
MMEQKSTDPGLGEKYLGNASRSINPDGSFNIIKKGVTIHYKDLYHYLINISWMKFFMITFTGYVLANFLFAIIYYFTGDTNLQSTTDGSFTKTFYDGLFFSVQTLTTVGYGGIVPRGILTNTIAAIEAMTGLLGFAVTTGLLYGRFSKPSARILFSKNILISRYKNINALVFRIANERNTNLMEIEATVLFSYIELSSKDQVKKYPELKLERNSVYFFPLNWTIVHPIDSESPLFGKTSDDLKKIHAEFLVLVKGFDDTFSQVVHSRYSYSNLDIIWGGKFLKAYSTDESGKIVFDLNDIHKFMKEELN